MDYSYDGLWKLLIDKKLKKKDLQSQCGISPTTIAKMGRGESVSLDTIRKVCVFLGCQIGEAVSIPYKSEDSKND